MNDIFERLAALEHEQWSDWMELMMRVGLTEENLKRWERKMKTPYDKLTEKEKESDRVWAREVLKVMDRTSVSSGEIRFDIDDKQKFLDFMEEEGWNEDYGTIRDGVGEDDLEIHTGGWSDNEELLASKAVFTFYWMMKWARSDRGGHYFFRR